MNHLQEMVQKYLFRKSTGCLAGVRRGSILVVVMAVLALLSPQAWYGAGSAYGDETGGGDSGGAGDAGDAGGGDEGDAGDAGGGDEGDAGGDEAGDGAEDGADDDAADDDAADDEPADDEPADDEPADDEPEDEGDDADEEDDNEADNEDEIEDDADSDDDTELGEELSDSPLAPIRRFALDGVRSSSLTVVSPSVRAEWKKSRGSMKRLGAFSGLVLLQQQEPHLLSNWDDPLVPVVEKGGAEPMPEDQEIPSLKLPPTGLPAYRAGDTFVYSDGTWERVVAADRYGVRWVNHRGNPSSGSLDFTYKRAKWQSSTRQGSREFQQTAYLFGKSTTTLWPLAVGNVTRFDEFGRWSTGDGVIREYDSFWRCEVEGTERIAVAVGEFDSWRITCSRYPDSFSYPKAKAREYKTWNYSPALGHWLVEDRDNRGYRPNRRKELVAVMPDLLLLTGDEKDVAQLQGQFQDVMENYKSGQSDMWIEKSGTTTSTVVPKATLMREDGLYCRQYLQYIQGKEYSATYAGIGCRGVDGIWRIIRR